MVYLIIVPLAWVAWHLVFFMRVKGRENLIKGRGFVIVCNHISALDPVFIILARFFGKKLIILGKQEVFKNPFVAWFLKSVGVVPIQRGKGDTKLIENVVDKVKNQNRGCLLFPEGTRSKDGNLQRLKSGAFVIAQQTGVDIIPCRMIYKGGKLKLFNRSTLIIGKPITCEELGLTDMEHSAKALRNAKQIMTEKLEQLLEDNREYC